jgi:sensor histidine kinase regulating citrate/malate metabolism
LLPEDSNGSFPGHVSEGALSGSQVSVDVDSAVEAVEGMLKFCLIQFWWFVLLLLEYFCAIAAVVVSWSWHQQMQCGMQPYERDIFANATSFLMNLEG